jgi:transcription elongation factor/antiterminator RfaH
MRASAKGLQSCDPQPTLEEGESWYVVRSQPHRESLAAQQLNNQGFRTFLPRYFKSRRHARKFETVLAPLFPRYLFVVLDTGRDRWRSVNGTYGVERILTRGGQPEPVLRGLVEHLVAVTQQDGSVCFRPALREGQTVRVTAGPFATLVGKLEHLDDHGRVRVLLEIMGGKVPVLVPETSVMLAEEAT